MLRNVQRRGITSESFLKRLWGCAQDTRQRIVLPEPGDPRVLAAACEVVRRGLADVTLIGNETTIRQSLQKASPNDPSHDAIHIVDNTTTPLRDNYAHTMCALRKHKNLTLPDAHTLLDDPPVFATMMVASGDVDGMVSGAVHTSADTIRPALQFIGKPPGGIVSSLMFMLLAGRVVVYADCALQVSPNSEELARIAAASALTSSCFGIDPDVALLSYATGMSNDGPQVAHVREAVDIAAQLVKNDRVHVPVSGPLQYDAAFSVEIARQKGVTSEGARSVFVFPDLNCGI